MPDCLLKRGQAIVLFYIKGDIFMKIFKNLFNFSIFLIFTLSFTTFNAFADEVVDEVESVEASAEVSESEDDEDVTDVGRVTVTGSRIKRIDIEGATPIQVITRADIDQAGYGLSLIHI